MSTVQQTRHQNLLILIKEAGGVQAVADRIERSYSQVSQLKNRSIHSTTGKPRDIGSDIARLLEARFNRPAGWMDQQHPLAGEGTPTGEEAHILSHHMRSDAPLVSWEALMTMDHIPPVFWVASPDDSMAPRVRAGDILEFDSRESATPGDGVLVRDKTGALYFRRYRQGSANTWQAYPTNDAYRTLDSSADGLQIVAVLIGIPRQRWR